jgi:hypothetical protein
MSLEPLQAFPAGPEFPVTDDLKDIRIIRTRPRVYLHRLAQMIGANPSQRRQLLMAEKYPSPFRVSYYPAKRLFRDALRLGWTDDDLFNIATERWWPIGPETDYAAFRRRQALDATEEFSLMLERVQSELGKRDACVHLSNRIWLPMTLAGVRIADSPGIVLRRNRRGSEQVGLLTFHISKTRPHTDETAALAAGLLEVFARNNQTREVLLEPELCVVIDVFGGQVVDASAASSRDLCQLELACEEIAACWSQL